MIYAISGARGFIGKHLVKRLEELGHKTIRIDRFGNFPKCDYIVDLASYGNYHFQTDVKKIFEVNVMRLIHILDRAKDIKGIVLTSSASVELPVTTFYGASKLAIESLGKAYDLPIVTLRPATIVGVGEAEHHLIPTLIKSCFKNDSMPFDPKPTHDFVAVEDYVEAVIKSCASAEKLKGKVLSVGSGKCHSNLEIKNLVEKISGYKANVYESTGLRKQDVKKWIVKRPKGLNWRPKISIEESINRMVHDYLDQFT